MFNFVANIFPITLYHVRIFYHDDRANGLLGTFTSIQLAHAAIREHTKEYSNVRFMDDFSVNVEDRFGNEITFGIQKSRLNARNFSSYRVIK